MMVGGNGAWGGGDMGVEICWDLVGFGWGIVVWGAVFLLVFCLIIYIYFMVYIGGYWFVSWMVRVGLKS